MVGFMNFRDSNQGSQEGKYISKRVMINGQYVTLYSTNGQTWLSSPEDIPALMERLDNARITLNTAEKVADGEGSKAAKPDSKEKEETDSKAKEQPEKVLQTKYRVKGPKPRPILRQDGVVIKGTPIEPISASSTVLTFSSDQGGDDEEGAPSPKKKPSNGESGQKGALASKKGEVRSTTAKAAKTDPKKPDKVIAQADTHREKDAKKISSGGKKVIAAKNTKKEVAKAVTSIKASAKKGAAKNAKPAAKTPQKKVASSKKSNTGPKAKKK
jgi:hypothetical protein